MTGFRVGYLIGDKNYINKIQLTNETINSCLPPFIQIAAAHALNQDYESKYSKFREIIKIGEIFYMKASQKYVTLSASSLTHLFTFFLN